MQSFRRFLLHCDTKGITFDITTEQRTNEQRYANRYRDHKENRNRRGKN